MQVLLINQDRGGMWEPEAPASEGYSKGCFQDGMPTQALDVFKEIK